MEIDSPRPAGTSGSVSISESMSQSGSTRSIRTRSPTLVTLAAARPPAATSTALVTSPLVIHP